MTSPQRRFDNSSRSTRYGHYNPNHIERDDNRRRSDHRRRRHDFTNIIHHDSYKDNSLNIATDRVIDAPPAARHHDVSRTSLIGHIVCDRVNRAMEAASDPDDGFGVIFYYSRRRRGEPPMYHPYIGNACVLNRNVYDLMTRMLHECAGDVFENDGLDTLRKDIAHDVADVERRREVTSERRPRRREMEDEGDYGFAEYMIRINEEAERSTGEADDAGAINDDTMNAVNGTMEVETVNDVVDIVVNRAIRDNNDDVNNGNINVNRNDVNGNDVNNGNINADMNDVNGNDVNGNINADMNDVNGNINADMNDVNGNVENGVNENVNANVEPVIGEDVFFL